MQDLGAREARYRRLLASCSHHPAPSQPDHSPEQPQTGETVRRDEASAERPVLPAAEQGALPVSPDVSIGGFDAASPPGQTAAPTLQPPPQQQQAEAPVGSSLEALQQLLPGDGLSTPANQLASQAAAGQHAASPPEQTGQQGPDPAAAGAAALITPALGVASSAQHSFQHLHQRHDRAAVQGLGPADIWNHPFFAAHAGVKRVKQVSFYASL